MRSKAALHFRGIPVFMDWWTALMAVVFADYWTSDATVGFTRAVHVAVFAVGILASVLAHEIAHAWTGQRSGEAPTAIVLSAFGGVTHMQRPAATPWAMVKGAGVGPLSNLAIGLCTVPLWRSGHADLMAFGILNLSLAGYNLLPAFPLDGGSVLTGVLWKVTGSRERAVRAVARIGQLIALGAVAFAMGSSELDLVGRMLIAWLAATVFFASKVMVSSGGGVGRVTSGAVVSPKQRVVQRATSADVNDSVADAIARADEAGARGVLVTQDDQVIGLLVADEVRQLDSSQRSTERVQSWSMRLPTEAFVHLDRPDEVAAAIQARIPVCVALDAQDAIVGIVDRFDLVGWNLGR